MQHNLIFAKWQIEQTFTIIRLVYRTHLEWRKSIIVIRIGECPSNSPFLKNNGAEVPKGPRPIVFKEWRDTSTFSNLKSAHCTLLIVLIINLVTKKKSVYYQKYKENNNSAPVHIVHLSPFNRFTSQVDFKM